MSPISLSPRARVRVAPGKLMAVKLKNALAAAAGVVLLVLVGPWARATATERTTRTKAPRILYFKVSSPSSLNLEPTGRLRLLSFRCSLQPPKTSPIAMRNRSEEHTSELQSPCNLVCRLLLEKKKKKQIHLSSVAVYLFISS